MGRRGVCVGDYNNDGFEDLFLTYYGQNKLYRNNGNGTFTDVHGESWRICTHDGIRFGAGCTFIDYNPMGSSICSCPTMSISTWPNALKPSLNIRQLQLRGRALWHAARRD